MSNKFNIVGLIGLLLLFFFSVSGQVSNYRETFLEADSYFLYEEYNEALPLFAKLHEKDQDNYYLDYKIGRCYLNIPHDKKKSIYYLQRASQHIDLKITKESDWKERNSPLDVLLYLGDAYRINEQLTKAIDSYLEFKDKAPEKIYDFLLVEHQIKSVRRAISMTNNAIDVDETNLDATINTRFTETNPVVSNDESMMVYASRLQFYQAMFYTTKENGQWSYPINMIPMLGIDGDCIPVSLSSDGKELYVYRSDGFLGDIYVTNYKNDTWTKLRKLNANINTKYWESHASISNDGKTLYFSSNRPGGFGELDIYKSTRTSGDDWGIPVNLGSEINSEYNDDNAFITPEENTIFFSSFGHETMGGYDIFYSKCINGKWAKPINVGYPISTTDDDFFFCPVKNGMAGYISKFDDKGKGKSDINRFEIYSDANPRKYQVIGNISFIDLISNNKPVYVAIYDKFKKDTIYRTFLKGKDFTQELISGNYEVSIKKSGFETELITLSIPKGTRTKEKLVNVSLRPEKVVITQTEDTAKSEIVTIGNSIAAQLKTSKPTTSNSATKKSNTTTTTSKSNVKTTAAKSKSTVKTGVTAKKSAVVASKEVVPKTFPRKPVSKPKPVPKYMKPSFGLSLMMAVVNAINSLR